MQYTVTIRQAAAVRAGLNVDIIDLAIFDFIKDYSHSKNCLKLQTDTCCYYWISHSLIIKEMPLLGISTGAGIVKHINRLIDAGLLKRHPNCELLRKTFYAFGPNYDAVVFTPNESCEAPTKVWGTPNESCGATPNKSCGYQYTNNQSTIEHNAADGGLFPAEQIEQPKQRGTTEPLCLFADSKYNTFEAFAACFDGPEYAQIDLMYYYGAVADWSSRKKKKQNDWIATARGFMRSDKRDGKLQMLKTQEQSQLDMESFKKFMTGDYGK